MGIALIDKSSYLRGLLVLARKDNHISEIQKTIILKAGRSFTEPAGLLPSNFSKIVLELFGSNRCRRTRGVLPIVSARVKNFVVFIILLYFSSSKKLITCPCNLLSILH